MGLNDPLSYLLSGVDGRGCVRKLRDAFLQVASDYKPEAIEVIGHTIPKNLRRGEPDSIFDQYVVSRVTERGGVCSKR